MGESRPTLLCVANYPSNTGYAWNFIEGMFARIASRLTLQGIRTLVAYPKVDDPPHALYGSSAEWIESNINLGNARSVLQLLGLIWREKVRILYFTDREVFSPAFPVLRLAGVRRIVIHDHTSGERTRPEGIKRLLKWLRARAPWCSADLVIGVSDFVVRRQVEVGLMPAHKVVRLWNSVDLPDLKPDAGRPHAAALGVPPGRLLILCSGRATQQKGIDHLLRAFDHVIREWQGPRAKPVLLYIGDGPAFPDLQQLHRELPAKADIILAGFQREPQRLLAEADLCVVPSVWQEGFGLAALEPMAYEKPVIATRVGGLPEIIEDGVSGLLVPPADEEALAKTLLELIADQDRARRLGRAARERVELLFRPEDKLEALAHLLTKDLG